jgi:hypothetical protein
MSRSIECRLRNLEVANDDQPGIIACDQAEVDEKLAAYKGGQEPTTILTGVPRAVQPIASSRLS